MTAFVFSFGTVEIIEGILVVDSQITFKTFEKEYSEILKLIDKSIKNYLKNAFDKGEYEIKNVRIEKNIADLLNKLEDYDKPSFDFTGESPILKNKLDLNESIQPAAIEPLEQEEPSLINESDVIENLQDSAENLPQTSEIIEEELGPVPEKPKKRKSKKDKDILRAADFQDNLTLIDDGLNFEEPEVIQLPPEKIEEISVTEVELQSEGIQSDFIVHLTEHADFKLDHDQIVQDAKIDGKLLLKNTGKKDRIWDINIALDKIEETSLTEDILHLNELNPGSTFEYTYEVKNFEKIPLIFRERINTFSEGSEEIHTLIFNQSSIVEFTFFLENPFNHEITDLTLVKTFPKVFTDLKVIGEIPSNTKVRIQDESFIWEGITLQATQSISLKLQVKVFPKTLESIKTGPIEIKFTRVNDLYTDLSIKDIASLSNNMYYIEKDEKEELPNNWTYRFIFENKSEFPMLLESAEIFLGDINTEQKETVFRAINEIIRPNEEEWVSKEWDLISEDIPTFGKKVKFKIIPVTTKSFTANLAIDETELPILWATCEKTYSLSEIASYVDTSIDVKIALLNEGEAEINEIAVKDFIPENFMPPSLNEIKFLLNGEPLNLQERKVEIQIQREPDSDEANEPHQISIELLNLKDNIASIEKGSNFEIQYSIVAIKPPPEKVYAFPTTITINSFPRGAPLEINPSMIKNSDIKVTHHRRKLTVGKSVSPGAEDGEFEIMMIFKNRGNTAIENAVVSDLIPENFQILASEPEAEASEIDSKTLLEWKFEVILPGKKVELSYKIKGTGEYKTSDAEIFYKV